MPAPFSWFPWVLAGAISYGCLQVVMSVPALISGQVPLSTEAGIAFLVLLVGVSILGAVAGFVFAFLHPRVSMGIVVKGIVFFVAETAFFQVVGKGPAGLISTQFALAVALSIGAGALFSWIGVRLGGT